MQKRIAWTTILCCGVFAGCGETTLEPIDQSVEKSQAPQVPMEVSALEPKETQVPQPPLPPAAEPVKTINAKSVINKPAPEFVVEQWLTSIPDRKGKMVLIDFWATWCGPCIASIPKLSKFQRDHEDRLVVIGVSDEPGDVVRNYRGARMDYSVAYDTERRMYDELGVRGIPHLILVDPTGIVRWEGFPTLRGHELTDNVLTELLDTYVR